MASLEEDVRNAIPASGTYSVIVKTQHYPQKIKVNPEAEYEAASTSKLSIAYVVLEMIELGELDPSYPSLELKKHHKRTGTGILRHFGNGFTLSPETALYLLLMESDNTAANLLLEKIGGQSEVNSRMRSLDFAETGLTDRDDNLFESGVASAEGMFAVFERFMYQTHDTESGRSCLRALKDSHFVEGFRRTERVTPHNVRPTALRARLLGLSGQQRLQHRLLREFLRCQITRSQVLSKEGILPDYEGKSYLHELGCFHKGRARAPLTLAAVFSSGTPDEGYTIEEAKDVLARIGARVYEYSRFQ